VVLTVCNNEFNIFRGKRLIKGMQQSSPVQG
jgi:hypothetical protein